MVDNHCHLDIPADDVPGEPPSVGEALARSAAVGVPRIVQIGCDLPGARWAVEVAAGHDAIVAGVALHPNEAPRLDAEGRLDDALAEIADLARHDECGRWGRPGSTTSGPARRAGLRRCAPSAGTSSWRTSSTRPW